MNEEKQPLVGDDELGDEVSRIPAKYINPSDDELVYEDKHLYDALLGCLWFGTFSWSWWLFHMIWFGAIEEDLFYVLFYVVTMALDFLGLALCWWNAERVNVHEFEDFGSSVPNASWLWRMFWQPPPGKRYRRWLSFWHSVQWWSMVWMILLWIRPMRLFADGVGGTTISPTGKSSCSRDAGGGASIDYNPNGYFDENTRFSTTEAYVFCAGLTAARWADGNGQSIAEYSCVTDEGVNPNCREPYDKDNFPNPAYGVPADTILNTIGATPQVCPGNTNDIVPGTVGVRGLGRMICPVCLSYLAQQDGSSAVPVEYAYCDFSIQALWLCWFCPGAPNSPWDNADLGPTALTFNFIFSTITTFMMPLRLFVFAIAVHATGGYRKRQRALKKL